MAAVRIFAILLMTFVSCMTSAVAQDDFLNDTFPDDFRWGAATSAYQVEGAWNLEGKGDNIWDRFCHLGGRVHNNETGDVACDSYHLYNDDIALLKNLEVHFYRFSISWARVMVDGTIATVNEAGIAYYNRLIDAMLAAGISPMVTLYHWDLPQALQDIGGWQNEDLVMLFNDYARLCFERFGDRVKWWLTFNEPWVVSWLGHGIGIFAPGVYSPDIGTYRVTHTIIKAHAEAWHTYDTQFREAQQGQLSITLDCDWKEPFSDSPEDIEAAERAIQFKLGWFGHPIFVNGDYPEVMKIYVAMKSEMEGRNQSRLPEFTESEKLRIRGTYDYMGLNHYTTQLVRHFPRGTEWPSWENDRDVEELIDPDWPSCGADWLKIVPWGMRKLLGWIKEAYGNPRVIITENGVADDLGRNDTLADTIRSVFIRDYVNNVLKAIKLDECNVGAYTAWSLMDNFEWTSGYSLTFGLHHVDFTDDRRPRTPKQSAEFYRQLIRDNGWPSA